MLFYYYYYKGVRVVFMTLLWKGCKSIRTSQQKYFLPV